MPLYDFECGSCKRVEEVKQRMDEVGKVFPACPKCKRSMRRLYSPPLTTLWAGKFQGRWAKTQRDELGDIQW